MTQIQRDKITAFFEELLLEHGGAYTLFGSSKPITIEDLLTVEDHENTLQFIKEHPGIDFISVERNLEEGWEEWKKVSRKYKTENFKLQEIAIKNRKFLILVNVKATQKMMKKHYNIFQKIMGKDFDPEKCFAESAFFEKVFSNSEALGILLGYGKKNSELFAKRTEEDVRNSTAVPSENNDPRIKAECYLNTKPFRIPIFVMLDQEESKSLVKNYKKERNKIKSHYQNRNFLNETLKQLRSKD